MQSEQSQKPQITIFSTTTCPFCKKSKALLSELDIPYVEINLASYPTKRSDMIELADRLSVPQIFIHNKHIGGASDLQNLHEQNELINLINKQALETTPLDPRLNIPDIPPVEPFNIEVLNNPLDYEKIEINDKCYNHWEIRDILSKELDIKDRKYYLKTYKKCFIGKDLTDFLMKKFSIQRRGDAITAAEKLFESGFFHHVVQEHKFEDKELYYRLYGDEENEILNNFKKIPVGTKLSANPFDLVEGIKKKFETIKNEFTDKDGLVDYTKIKSHKDFNNFQESFSELQLVEMENMSEDERLAFVINVYNMTIKIAFAIIGVPKSFMQRYKFYDNYKINIGQNLYSFNELESGILRENKKSPGHFSRHFGENDPRKKNTLSKMDYRIHFALNCGAKSCPPVKKFTAVAVRQELRINSQAFCEDDGNVKIDAGKKQLWLSKIFDWYGGDFGKNDEERIQVICDLLRGEKQQQLQNLIKQGGIKIKLLPYDWSNDSK